MRNMKLGFFIISAIALVVLWQPHRLNIGVPTPTFTNYLDLNRDGDVSRYEWQLLHRVTDLSAGDSIIFERSDCNQNGRLSWSEYFDGKIKLETCNTDSLHNIIPTTTAPHSERFIGILTEDEHKQIFNASSYDLTDTLRRLQTLIPNEISEEYVISSPVLSCESPYRSTLPAYFLRDTAQRYPVIECSLTNTSKEAALTLIVFRIDMSGEQTTFTSWHAKSLFIKANSEKNIFLIADHDVEDMMISISLARGMKDGL